jgi:hypothetical protein
MSSDDLLGAIFDPTQFDPLADAGQGRAFVDVEQENSFESHGIPLSFLLTLREVASVWPQLRRVLLHSGETAIILRMPTMTADSDDDDEDSVEGGDDVRDSAAPLPAQIRALDADGARVIRTYRHVDAADVVATIPAAVGERVFWSSVDEGDVGSLEKSAVARPEEAHGVIVGDVVDSDTGGARPEDSAGDVHRLFDLLSADSANSHDDGDADDDGDDGHDVDGDGGGGGGGSGGGDDDDDDDDDEFSFNLLDFKEPQATLVLRSLDCSGALYEEWCPDKFGVVLRLEPSTMCFSLALSPAVIDSHENRQANYQSFSGCSTATVAVSLVARDVRFTTKDVCEEVIVPLTRVSKRSIVKILTDAADRLGTDAPYGTQTAATAFVSHAWQYTFVDMVDAVKLWADCHQRDGNTFDASASDSSESPTSVSLWLDIATVPQHPEAQRELPHDFFFNQFMSGIRSIGRTVSVMWPAHSPILVSRSWCVWEIWCTMTSGAAFETALTERDQATLLSSSGFSGLSVNVQEATAWDVRDAARILAACETVGYDVVNRHVQEAFAMDQVRRVAEQHANASPDRHMFLIDFISLSGLCMGASACALLAQYMKSAVKPVVVVLLWDCTGPRSGYTEICEAVGECAGLNRVHISNEESADGDAISVANLQSGDPIAAIAASAPEESGFGGTAVVALAASLVKNRSVDEVLLNRTAMSSDDFAAFATAALGANCHVRELDVANHAGLLAGDTRGAAALASALANNTSLTRLVVSGTGLDDDAALALADALSANPATALADMHSSDRNPGLTSVGSKALKRATLPALRRASAAVPSPPDAADASSEEAAEHLRLAWIKERTKNMERLLALRARTETELGHVDEGVKAYERLIEWMRREAQLNSNMDVPRRLKVYQRELAIATAAIDR